MVFELQSAQRMGNRLQRITNTVREVIHRINAPVIARALMGSVADTVNHRVAQINIRRGHIDLQPQHVFALGEFTRAHALKQVEVFLYAALPVWTVLSGFSKRATGKSHGFSI